MPPLCKDAAVGAAVPHRHRRRPRATPPTPTCSPAARRRPRSCSPSPSPTPPRAPSAASLDIANNDGLPTDPDHCVVSLKRLDVSTAAAPNQQPDARATSTRPRRAASPRRSTTTTASGSTRPARIWPRGTSPPSARPTPPSSSPTAPTKRSRVSWFTTAGHLDGGRSIYLPPGCNDAVGVRRPAPRDRRRHHLVRADRGAGGRLRRRQRASSTSGRSSATIAAASAGGRRQPDARALTISRSRRRTRCAPRRRARGRRTACAGRRGTPVGASSRPAVVQTTGMLAQRSGADRAHQLPAVDARHDEIDDRHARARRRRRARASPRRRRRAVQHGDSRRARAASAIASRTASSSSTTTTVSATRTGCQTARC